MSGHSKWHNIQGRKGKQDAVKSGVFTKLARAITIAAQTGADPATNFSLRLAIDKAKESSMPKDNIDRAIKRGTGELADEARAEDIVDEAEGILIKTKVENLQKVLNALKTAKIEPLRFGIEWVAKDLWYRWMRRPARNWPIYLLRLRNMTMSRIILPTLVSTFRPGCHSA